MSLRRQLLLLQVAIVLITVVGTGIVASWLQEQQLRDAYRDRMIGVAQSVARLPAIIDAFDEQDPSATIQPIAEVVRKASNVTYVVVTNDKGIRYSHPDPARIGHEVSTDPGTALSGKMYVGTQTGTLGESWRVKLPIFDANHKVMGVVSVGILESDLRNDYLGNSTLLFITIGVAAILGMIGAAGVSAVIRRRIYGLEPDEIAGLLETREAMLHGVREGLVALDDSGRISLINDAGVRLLGLDPQRELVGLPASDVLDPELIRMAAEETSEQRLVLSGERVLLVRRTRPRSAIGPSAPCSSCGTTPNCTRCCGIWMEHRTSPTGCVPGARLREQAPRDLRGCWNSGTSTRRSRSSNGPAAAGRWPASPTPPESATSKWRPCCWSSRPGRRSWASWWRRCRIRPWRPSPPIRLGRRCAATCSPWSAI